MEEGDGKERSELERLREENDRLKQLESAVGASALLHDLRVHQAELEAQNKELREMQALLEDSRNRYVDLYDFAPIGYLSFDEDGTIRKSNLAAASLLRRTRGDLLGKSFILVGSVGDTEAFRRHLGNAFASNEIQTLDLELDLDVPARAPTWVRLISQRARPYEGAVWCRTAILDVTERKRAEEAMIFLAQASTELVSSLDYRTTLGRVAHLAVPRLGECCVVSLARDDGSLEPIAVAHVDASREASLLELRRALGYDPRLERGAMHVVRTGRLEVYPPMGQDAGNRGPLDATHPRFLRQIGARGYLTVPLFARGKTLGTLTFVTISSERRFGASDLMLAEALAPRCAQAIDNARLYRDAQQAIRARQDLLAVVSHDLKNPLSAIALSTQMLRKVEAPVDRAILEKRLSPIERGVDQMEYLIRDLLDLSSIEAGHLKIERSPHSLQRLVEDAIELARPLATQRSLTLCTELPQEDLLVSCDRRRVARIFSNLLGNAIKFTPSGGTITVGALSVYGDVRISIADTGPGISGERLPHVFERYWQAEETSRNGAGLGLFIAKAIVESHGGRIWARSSVGQGSVFFFTLPLAAEGVASPSSRGPTTPRRWSERRVLIVEDNEDARESLADVLRTEGYTATTAGNGSEALTCLEDEEMPPGLILLDLTMPVMDGFMFKAAVKGRPDLATIPIVVMSGDRRIAEFAVHLEAVGYVSKPLRAERLLATIDRCGRWE